MASKRKQRRAKERRKKAGVASETSAAKLSACVLWWPLSLTLALAGLSLVPRVQVSSVLAQLFLAAAALFAWQTALLLRLKSESLGRSLRVELRPQHYLQATDRKLYPAVAVVSVENTLHRLV